MAKRRLRDYKQAIQLSKKTIYDPIDVNDVAYWIPNHDLESLLTEGMKGEALRDARGNALKNRTRSKVIKTLACKALGYPVPKSFKKTQPRFVGQQFDTYGQKAMNLQIWNEELAANRRYAIVQISEDDVVLRVKVVSGTDLTLLDKTGTITTKYQAQLETRSKTHELVTHHDTPLLLLHVSATAKLPSASSPTDNPTSGTLLPIGEIFERLSPLVGQSFADPGADQERNRGAELHRLACRYLGYNRYGDTGQFPDIRHQLLEVKLQTSPTIDLGLVLPSSEERLSIQPFGDHHPRHCDTRYAMFYAKTDGAIVTLTHLFVITGADFFKRFRRFEGKGTSGKIQIPLPQDFFSR